MTQTTLNPAPCVIEPRNGGDRNGAAIRVGDLVQFEYKDEDGKGMMTREGADVMLVGQVIGWTDAWTIEATCVLNDHPLDFENDGGSWFLKASNTQVIGKAY